MYARLQLRLQRRNGRSRVQQVRIRLNANQLCLSITHNADNTAAAECASGSDCPLLLKRRMRKIQRQRESPFRSIQLPGSLYAMNAKMPRQVRLRYTL